MVVAEGFTADESGPRASYKKVFLQAGDYSVGGEIRDRYSARACLPTEKATFQVMAASTGLSSQLGGGQEARRETLLGGRVIGRVIGAESPPGLTVATAGTRS